jgi:hypothetical protein
MTSPQLSAPRAAMTIAALWSTCPTKRHRPQSNSLWERDFVCRPTRTHRRFDCCTPTCSAAEAPSTTCTPTKCSSPNTGTRCSPTPCSPSASNWCAAYAPSWIPNCASSTGRPTTSTCSCITPPSLPISLLVNRLKGVSSRRLRQQYRTDVRKYLWGKHFWSPSYFAASCGGARLTAIKQDIEQQNRRN